MGHSIEHQVKDGDSLEWLAEKYSTTVPALKSLNNLQDDLIFTGSVLKIYKPPRLRGFHVLLKKNLTARDATSFPTSSEPKTDCICPFNTSPLFRSTRCITLPPKLKTVRIRFGDTLADIAHDHGISVTELQQLNNLQDDVIFEGDVLAVSSGNVERTFTDIRPGERRTKRHLFSRQRETNGRPFRYDNLKLVREWRETVDLRTPGCWQKRKGFECLCFSSPLTDGFISSPFGWRWNSFHEGVDLATDQGTPIFASERGKIMSAGWSGWYMVKLENGYIMLMNRESTTFFECHRERWNLAFQGLS